MYSLNSDAGRAIMERLTSKQLVDTFNALASSRGENTVKKFENNAVGRRRLATLAQLWDLRILDSGEIVESTYVAPVEQPPVEQPPVEQPPVEQPPVEQPPVEQPPVDSTPRSKSTPISFDTARIFQVPSNAVEPNWKVQITGKMPRKSSKVCILIELMMRPEGMTDEEGSEAIGWNGCSTTAARGALVAGLRVFYAKEERGTVYYARPPF